MLEKVYQTWMEKGRFEGHAFAKKKLEQKLESGSRQTLYHKPVETI